jgi:hypothetical protein
MPLSRSRRSYLHIFLLITLPAFFLIGGLGNLFPSATILADYDRWGYPIWFHYVTGGAELLAALLLSIAATRLWGTLLGIALMAAAFLTLIIHGEWGHALAPFIAGLALALHLWLNRNGRRRR